MTTISTVPTTSNTSFIENYFGDLPLDIMTRIMREAEVLHAQHIAEVERVTNKLRNVFQDQSYADGDYYQCCVVDTISNILESMLDQDIYDTNFNISTFVSDFIEHMFAYEGQTIEEAMNNDEHDVAHMKLVINQIGFIKSLRIYRDNMDEDIEIEYLSDDQVIKKLYMTVLQNAFKFSYYEIEFMIENGIDHTNLQYDDDFLYTGYKYLLDM